MPPQLVGIAALSMAVACLHLADSSARASRGPIVWSAGMETGNLSEWGRHASHDSGRCSRPPNGVSPRHTHTGKYAMQLTINTEFGVAGCRQSRNAEAKTGGTFVYSAWYYLPRREVPTKDMWNVFQFKSSSPTVDSFGSDPFWTINIVRSRGGPLRLVLKWKGGLTDHSRGVSGPFAGSPIQARMWRQSRMDVPVRRWFKISAHLKQSGAFGGRLVVRQNGVLLWDMRDVRTKYPDGTESWSVTNYSNGIRDNPATIYIDDVNVARP